MNVDSIRAYCLSFPDATENLQWGDDLCFKIGGKIFAIISLDNPRLCFKCTPETFAELIEREDIHPAPYVGRYKWVVLDRLDAVGWNELRELIRQSYESGGEGAEEEVWPEADVRFSKKVEEGPRFCSWIELAGEGARPTLDLTLLAAVG